MNKTTNPNKTKKHEQKKTNKVRTTCFDIPFSFQNQKTNIDKPPVKIEGIDNFCLYSIACFSHADVERLAPWQVYGRSLGRSPTSTQGRMDLVHFVCKNPFHPHCALDGPPDGLGHFLVRAPWRRGFGRRREAARTVVRRGVVSEEVGVEFLPRMFWRSFAVITALNTGGSLPKNPKNR